MSEFLGEAQILIKPNTAAFATDLRAQLEAALVRAGPLEVPVLAAAAPAAAARVPPEAQARLEATALATKTQAVAAREAAASNVVLAEAVSTQGKAQASAAAETMAANRAVQEQIVSDRAAAAAAREQAAATRVQATHQEQLRRGVGATTLSSFGLRGATLAASGSFLIGAAAATALVKSLREASREQEALARAQAVFGGEADRLARADVNLASSYHLSAAAALSFEAVIGKTLQNLGFGQKATLALSQSLTKLGADLAARFKVPVEDALGALQKGLAGNLRSLRQFGVVVTATDVKTEALAETNKTVAKSLTDQELAQARLTLIQRQTAFAAGAAAEQNQRLAGQVNTLRAQLANLGAEIGTAAGPAVKIFAQEVNSVLSPAIKVTAKLIDLGRAVKDVTSKIPGFKGVVDAATASNTNADRATGFWGKSLRVLQDTAGSIINPLTTVHNVIDAYNVVTGKAVGPTQALASAMSQLDIETRIAAGDIGALNTLLGISGTSLDAFARGAAALEASRAATLSRLQAQAKGIQEGLVRIQIAGGTPEQQIAQLQKDIAAQQKIVAASHLSVSSRRAAEAQILQDQNQIASIRAAQAAAAKSAAAKAKQAADAAKRAAEERRRAEDQRNQDEIAALIQARQNKITLAQRTSSLADDIAQEKALLRLLEGRATQLAREIHDQRTQRQQLNELKQQEFQTTQTLKDLEQQQKQQRRAAEIRRAENRVQSAELDVELAQTDKNIKAEIRARQKEIAALEAERKITGLGTLKYKELRNAIAEQEQAIKDLKKQLQQRKSAQGALELEFLQTQAGFAATILSNLLPAGALGGTVGGTTGGGPGGRPFDLSIAPHRFIDPRLTAATAAANQAVRTASQTAEGRAQRGASQGQMGQLIELTRQMIRILRHIDGQRAAPEARHNRLVGAHHMEPH